MHIGYNALGVLNQILIAESVGRLLLRFAHGCQDFLVARPRFAHKLGEQSTLSGNDQPSVHNDVELSKPALFELDGSPQRVLDEGSETRCLCGSCSSGLTVDDSDIHREDYTSAPSLQTNNPGNSPGRHLEAKADDVCSSPEGPRVC